MLLCIKIKTVTFVLRILPNPRESRKNCRRLYCILKQVWCIYQCLISYFLAVVMPVAAYRHPKCNTWEWRRHMEIPISCKHLRPRSISPAVCRAIKLMSCLARLESCWPQIHLSCFLALIPARPLRLSSDLPSLPCRSAVVMFYPKFFLSNTVMVIVYIYMIVCKIQVGKYELTMCLNFLCLRPMAFLFALAVCMLKNPEVYCRIISGRPVVKKTGARLNFMTSSSEALQLAQAVKELENVHLYLATWYPPLSPRLSSHQVPPSTTVV